MEAIEEYFGEMLEIKATGGGTAEISYYDPLRKLLNAAGATLAPRVLCVGNPKNQGAGFPDNGLYTADQLVKDVEYVPQTLPSRGAVEVKPLSDEVEAIAQSKQIAEYCKRYGIVLVTNYREFLTVERDANGAPRKSAFFSIAGSEKEFWTLAQHPKKFEAEQREHLREFLKHALLYAAPIGEPKDVAAHLAFHAREARARIGRKKLNDLDGVRNALAESLGLTFKGEEAELFFRSALVQALFYGIFAAWVFWSKRKPSNGERFSWKSAAHDLSVPVLRKLVHEISDPGRLKELKLPEVLDWAGDVLNRVERGPFFEAFQEENAVQYFYEPFLEAYDKQLRKELGVWYTPREIVHYMVERVDQALRSELGIADGLADSRVLVLDPCCGTGAYIVEVLRRIAKTLDEKGEDALSRHAVRKAAMERVFGFEILPAPFVISHLQIGMTLEELQAPLGEEERAAIYLTNALTGWEPPKDQKKQLLMQYQEMLQEQKAAEEVKRFRPILVVIGNPPYNAFAGVSPAEEGGLVNPYKDGLTAEWGVKKFNLDDLYVRFFRIAEKRITEKDAAGNNPKGVVSFISNFSYLDGASFVVMRKSFAAGFDRLWFDCLNGDSRETGKLTPEGKSDPSVFSTTYNKEGIRVGTAIATMVRREKRGNGAKFYFRQFWGTEKRIELLKSLEGGVAYEALAPSTGNRFSFRPMNVSAEYLAWPRVTDLSEIAPLNGMMEKRGGALIDIDREKLEERMQAYFDKGLTWEQYKATGFPLVKEQAAFDPETARAKALASATSPNSGIMRYQLRPFDVRWCYYTSVNPIWNRPRPELRAQSWKGNEFILTRFNASKSPEGPPWYFAKGLFDDHLLAPDAVALPLRVGEDAKASHANLSDASKEYLVSLFGESDEANALLWKHVLAIGYSPLYLQENEDGVRDDWPRAPLPDSGATLSSSAKLGQEVAELLDAETSVAGVTAGAVRPELARIAVVTRSSGGQLNASKGELRLEAGWGHYGKDRAVMPAVGKAREREYEKAELEAIRAGAEQQGLSGAQAIALLGDSTYDIWLNGIAYWKNVPRNIWKYTIGGYQVIKKWLSYREYEILGRSLTDDEVYEVRDMARRLAAIVLMHRRLDDNYAAVKAGAYKWPSGTH